jgi:hypothetical protein
MRYLMLLSIGCLAGCVAQDAVLVNDKGEKRYCYKPASGTFSNIGATQEFTRCLNEAGSAGFKRQD